jgi:hypothetical protein
VRATDVGTALDELDDLARGAPTPRDQHPPPRPAGCVRARAARRADDRPRSRASLRCRS